MTLGEACAVTCADRDTAAGDTVTTLTCVFKPELQSPSLEGSTHSGRWAPRCFSTLMPPPIVRHDSPISVGNAAISWTAASTVSTCGSEGALVSDLTFPCPTCRGSSIVDTCMVFCAEEYQAGSNDTSTSTCSHSSSGNTVDWVGEVPLCQVATGDVIASLRVDFSECFGLTYQETSVVRHSVGDAGAGNQNHIEFLRGGHGHLHGSLECAGERAKLIVHHSKVG